MHDGVTTWVRNRGLQTPAVVCLCVCSALVAGCAGANSTSSGSARTSTRDERGLLRERCYDLLHESSVSESALMRAHAIEGLKRSPDEARATILIGLSDPNAGVRFVAAMTAGDLELVDAEPRLRALLSDPDVRVQAAAMFALDALDKPVDLTPLSTWLMSGDPRIRAEVARVLGRIGNSSAAPMLRSAAAQRGSAPGGGSSLAAERLFQLQVAEAIVRLGEREESDSIRAALYPSEREGFEAAVLAAQILGEIKDERAVAQLVELVEQRVPGSRESSDPRQDQFIQPPELRLTAARSLALMGYPGGMYVADMHRDDRDPVTRSLVAFVYGASGQDRYFEPLRVLLEDESPLVQAAAATALLELLDASTTAMAGDPG